MMMMAIMIIMIITPKMINNSTYSEKNDSDYKIDKNKDCEDKNDNKSDNDDKVINDDNGDNNYINNRNNHINIDSLNDVYVCSSKAKRTTKEIARLNQSNESQRCYFTGKGEREKGYARWIVLF